MLNKIFKNRMKGKNQPKEEKELKTEALEDEAKIDANVDAQEKNEKQESEELDELTLLKRENEELKDKYLRLYSDFENFKRRTTKERIDLFKMAGQEVLKSLIPVMDDFERAEKAFETSTDSISLSEGIKLVSSKFKSTLEGQGLKSYTSVGESFDADLHEAITKIPAPSDDLKGKIVDEIEKGYKLQDKVIRFAKVIIGE
jgi:molecular chaperone GrpE